MNINRALALRDNACAALNDLFSRGRHNGMTHEAMLADRAKIYDRVAKCPRWVRDYLNGYWDCLQQSAYQHDLVYGAMINDKFYSTHSNRDDYYEKAGIEPSAFAADNPTKGHYWRSNLRPFFVSP